MDVPTVYNELPWWKVCMPQDEDDPKIIDEGECEGECSKIVLVFAFIDNFFAHAGRESY